MADPWSEEQLGNRSSRLTRARVLEPSLEFLQFATAPDEGVFPTTTTTPVRVLPCLPRNDAGAPGPGVCRSEASPATDEHTSRPSRAKAEHVRLDWVRGSALVIRTPRIAAAIWEQAASPGSRSLHAQARDDAERRASPTSNWVITSEANVRRSPSLQLSRTADVSTCRVARSHSTIRLGLFTERRRPSST